MTAPPPSENPTPSGRDALDRTTSVSADATHVIKRYANRKLYDTVLRRFTTLAQIEAQLRAGRTVVVLDHATGLDRTGETLGQTLGRRRTDHRPDLELPDRAVLSQLIRGTARATRAFQDHTHDLGTLRRLRVEVQALTEVLDDLLTAVQSAEETGSHGRGSAPAPQARPGR